MQIKEEVTKMFLKICAKSKKLAIQKIKEKNEFGSIHYQITQLRIMKTQDHACKSRGLKTYKVPGKYHPEKDTHYE